MSVVDLGEAYLLNRMLDHPPTPVQGEPVGLWRWKVRLDRLRRVLRGARELGDSMVAAHQPPQVPVYVEAVDDGLDQIRSLSAAKERARAARMERLTCTRCYQGRSELEFLQNHLTTHCPACRAAGGRR